MNKFAMFCCAIMISSVSFAKDQATPASKWYAGATIESSKYDLSEADLNSFGGYTLESPGDTRVDNSTTGYALFVGLQPSPYLSLQLGYTDFGQISYHLGYRKGYLNGPCPFLNCQPPRVSPSDYNVNVKGAFFRVRPMLPIGDRWAIDARLGLAFATHYLSSNDTGEQLSSQDLRLTYGLGAGFAIKPNIRIQAHIDFVGDAIESGTASYAPSVRVVSYQDTMSIKAIGIGAEYRW